MAPKWRLHCRTLSHACFLTSVSGACLGVTTAPLLAADGSILVSAGYDSAHAMWCEPVPDRPCQTGRRVPGGRLASDFFLRNVFCTFPFAGFPARRDRGGACSKPPSGGERFPGCTTNRRCASSLARTWRADLAGGVGRRQRQGAAGEGDCLIAFGCPPSAFTPGHDRQELDKRLVAALIEAAPAVFLDNLNSVALRSNTLASVLMEPACRTVRVMQRLVMVPLSAAFIALTGNGLSVSEDLARRFLEVLLDPQCEDPEARPFPKRGDILERRKGVVAAADNLARGGVRMPWILSVDCRLAVMETWQNGRAIHC